VLWVAICTFWGEHLHVLVTADTLTGVWAYTRELVTGLVSSGATVTLVSFGEIPLPHQISWMENLHGLDYRPTAFRLEWMQEGEADLEDTIGYLESVIREVTPDLVHASHFSVGSLPTKVPRLVVAHNDLISWWIAVHGHEPRETRWLRWYRDTVSKGLSEASAVIAPTNWMLETLRDCYGVYFQRELVIHHGRNPIYFNPYVSKEDSVLSIGRLWDPGKQVSLLTQHKHPLSICIVGSDNPTYAPRMPIRADVKVATDELSVALKGPQTEAQLRVLYSRAAIYAATSRYEPFGASAMEAALSRCAIVANDIPSLRELWGDTAVYFETNNADSLAETLKSLVRDRDLCRTYGRLAYQRARERFTARRMVDRYLDVYRELTSERAAAA
jgi:glycogen(starch) synthase